MKRNVFMGWVIIFAVAIGTVPAIGGTIYFSTYKEDLAGPPSFQAITRR